MQGLEGIVIADFTATGQDDRAFIEAFGHAHDLDTSKGIAGHDGALDRRGATGREQVGEPTYARKITPEEARIDWSRPARELDCHIRGLSPFPGAWTMLDTPKGEQRLKVLMSRASDLGSGEAPGVRLLGGLKIATGDGVIELLRVQREGKAAQDAADFLNGGLLQPGDRLR